MQRAIHSAAAESVKLNSLHKGLADLGSHTFGSSKVIMIKLIILFLPNQSIPRY